MSLYLAKVGEIIIKPEYRKDFGHLFRGEYDMIGDGIIADVVKEHEDTIIPFSHWKHYDEKDEWKGKYATAYDEETGFLSYGVCYNLNGRFSWTMICMFEMFEAITEKKISHDDWIEPS